VSETVMGQKKQKIKIDFFKRMLMSCSFIQMAQVNPHSECVEYLDELASVIGRLDDKTRKLLDFFI